jgi:hypothetical protein
MNILDKIDKYINEAKRHPDDIPNVNSKQAAEAILKKKGLKWDKEETTDLSGTHYSWKGKSVAHFFRVDKILSLFITNPGYFNA